MKIKTHPMEKMMKNKTLIISIVLVCITVTLALAVTTYAVWTEQADDFIDVQIPTSDFNPSAKYIVYKGLDANGNFTDDSIASYAVVGYSGIISELVIPETYEGLPVTRIYVIHGDTETNLAGNRFITSIIIPDSVTRIDEGVFANITGLKKVTLLGETGIDIGNLAFAGCVELSEFVYSDTKNITGDKASYLLNTSVNG